MKFISSILDPEIPKIPKFTWIFRIFPSRHGYFQRMILGSWTLKKENDLGKI